MAASLSRPDPSSPASVAEAGFTTSRRGFSQDEVRAFLTSVAAELGRLQERERQLDAQVRAAESQAPAVQELDDETVAALLGEETLRVLQTARESASQIKVRAEENAAKVLHDANDEANRLRQESEVEAARKRQDASADAEAEVALAKQQGREMVNEARAYRERVLGDLERRTKMARQQIEDLVQGRDRLVQVFERARLVAVDVASELQTIEGPAEFVNFSPTTGPVPVMVPASELDEGSELTATDAPVDAPAEVSTEEIEHIDDELVAVSGPDDTDTDGVDEDAADEVTEAVAIVEAEAEAEAEAADADVDVEDAEVEAEVPAKPVRDANVVSLFRDRVEEPAVESTESAESDADEVTEVTEPDERPDVGDIFERLRSENPEAEPAAEAEAQDESEDGDEAEADEPAPTPFTRRDEALVPLIVGGARKLKRVLADEQNGVLDLLRQKQPITQLDELIPELDEHCDSYVGALADELLEAAIAGAAEVGKRDSKTLRTTITKGGALHRAHAIVSDDLVVPLRSRLERAITDGAGDNEDITKRIRAVYREWKTQHIDDQLDDAFRFAHGGGMAAGVKPGTAMTWMVDASEPSCPDCEDNSLAGDVAAGEEFPTGHLAAPAHAGCRCLTVPSGQ